MAGAEKTGTSQPDVGNMVKECNKRCRDYTVAMMDKGGQPPKAGAGPCDLGACMNEKMEASGAKPGIDFIPFGKKPSDYPGMPLGTEPDEVGMTRPDTATSDTAMTIPDTATLFTPKIPDKPKPKFSAAPAVTYKPPPPTPLEIAAQKLAQIDMDGNKFSSCVNVTNLRLVDYDACMNGAKCPYVKTRDSQCVDRWKAYAREVAQLPPPSPRSAKFSLAGATKVPASGYRPLVEAVVRAGRGVLTSTKDPGSFAAYRKAQGKKESYNDLNPAAHKMCRLGDQQNPIPRSLREQSWKQKECPAIKEVVADLRAWGRSKGKDGAAFVENLDKYWLMSPVFHEELDARMMAYDGRVIFDGSISKLGWGRLLLPPHRQAGADRLLFRLRQPMRFSSCSQGDLCMYMDWVADTSWAVRVDGLKRLYPGLDLKYTPIMRATMRDVYDVHSRGGAHVEQEWMDRSAKPYAYEGKNRVARMTPADFVGRGGPFKTGDRVRLVHEPKSYSLDRVGAPCATVPAGTCGVVRTTPGARMFDHTKTDDYTAMYDIEWDASQTAVATEEGCERRLNDTMRAQLRRAPVFALESCDGKGGDLLAINARGDKEVVDKEEEKAEVVVSATYGEKRRGMQARTKDVTAVVDKLLQEQESDDATMRVTNRAMGGDPSPGFVKHLRVFVKRGDGPKKMVFKAQEHKTFQVSRLRQQLEAAGATSGGGSGGAAAVAQNLEGAPKRRLIAGFSIAGLLLFVVALAYPGKGLLHRLGAWMDRGENRQQLVMAGVLSLVAVVAGVWSLTYTYAPPDGREQTRADTLWGTGVGVTLFVVVAALWLLVYIRRRGARKAQSKAACDRKIDEWMAMTGKPKPKKYSCVDGEVRVQKFD